MSIRLIAFDLDGTALRGDKTVSPRTAAAIRRAHERGCVIVPASGRVLKTTPQEVLSLPGVRWCVVSNGASVMDLVERRQVYSDLMTRGQSDRILSLLCPTGYLVEAYAGGETYSARSALESMTSQNPPEWLLTLTMRTQTFVDDLQEYVRSRELCLEKINMPYLPPEEKDRLCAEIGAMKDYSVCSAFQTNLEINTAACSKGEALSHLCGQLGIRREEVMALGDGGNDVAMLRFAGLGVAMKNASDEALSAADCVTADNDEDGVAQAIEKYALS